VRDHGSGSPVVVHRARLGDEWGRAKVARGVVGVVGVGVQPAVGVAGGHAEEVPDRHGVDALRGVVPELRQVAEHRVVEVEQTFRSSNSDGGRSECLRDREDVTPIVGDPTMSSVATAVERDLQTFDAQVLFSTACRKPITPSCNWPTAVVIVSF
jgi:hypothetical protein